MANQFSVNSGFTLGGNSVLVGEEEDVQSGGVSLSATISSGGTEVVSSGGIASGTTVSNGGQLQVNDFNGSATAIGAVIGSGGSAFVGDGDAASGTLVRQGGTLVIGGSTVPGAGFGATVFGDEEVSFQGRTTSDVIASGGSINAQFGGSVIDAVVSVGGSLNINDGGNDTGATVFGTETLLGESPATATGDLIGSGGELIVGAGGVASGTTVAGGGTLDLLGQGVASNVTLDAGATLLVDSGAVVEVLSGTNNLIVLDAGNNSVGNIINNGATVRILSGGTEALGSGVVFGGTVSGGQTILALSGGAISGASVLGGGTAAVSSGGLITGTVLSSGGFESVFSGGTASGTIVESGGDEQVLFGGTAIGTQIRNGGLDFVFDGGTAIGAVVSSGGFIAIEARGTASGTTFVNGGADFVAGSAVNTSAGNFGGEFVQAGGVTTNTSVGNLGLQQVESGGTASGTVVSSGGTQIVSSGGVASGTTVSSGGTLALDGGTTTGGTVNAGGTLLVENGGVAEVLSGSTTVNVLDSNNNVIGSIVNNGSLQLGNGGTEALGSGVTFNGTISGGQTIEALSGAVISGATVLAGGSLAVSSGGVASGTVISNGGTEIVAASGTENNATIDGTLDLQSGGVVITGTLAAGGTLQVDSGANIAVNGSTISVLSAGTSVGQIGNAGGTVDILAGGIVSVTGGTVSGIVIESGGSESVGAGAADSGAFLNGGTQTVLGTVSGVTLDGSAIQIVSSGGIASSTTVDATDTLRVLSGGSAFGATINGGGTLDIFGGAVVSGGSLQPGATLILDDNAILSSTDGGATLHVLDPNNGTDVGDFVNGGATITISGSLAELDFSGASNFDNATINIGNTSTKAILTAFNGTLTLNTGAIVNELAGSGTIDGGGANAVVNSGTIQAIAGGGTLTIAPQSFTNAGTIAVAGGGVINISSTNFTNFNSATGDLSGGIYDIGGNSVIDLQLGSGTAITQLDATVYLRDSGATFNGEDGSGNPIDISQTLTTIGPNGALYVEGEFSPAGFGDLTDQGILQLGGTDYNVGNISIVGTRDVVLDGSFISINGNITETGGVGTVEINGGGSVALLGSNTYTGGTVVSDFGTRLQIFDSDSALGSLASTLSLGDGTTLELSQSANPTYTVSHNITIAGQAALLPDGGTTITVTGQIAGTGRLNVGLIFGGGGTLVLANSANDYTGGTLLYQGTLEIAAAGAAGTGAITFAPQTDPRLQIDAAALPPNSTFGNVISDFGFGDDIDLPGVRFAGTHATIDSNNLLTVTDSGNNTYGLRLAPPPVSGFNGDVFVLRDDGSGSTDIVASRGTVFSFGGNLESPIVFNGGVLSASNNTFVENAQVLSGGVVLTDSSTLIGTLIAPGGIVNLGGAATAENGTVFGDEEVFGNTVSDIVGAGGVENVYGAASGTTVENLGFLRALTGTVSGATISAGGRLVVDGPGSESGATVFGTEQVFGTAFGDTVGSGGVETVSSGGTASGTTVLSGGFQSVAAGGTASGTAVAAGGEQIVLGSTIGTTVSGGGLELVLSGGFANGTTVQAGGMLEVESGGNFSGVTIDPGGILLLDGFTLSGTVVGSGMELRIGHGSIARGAHVNSGGILRATSGAVTIGTNVGPGGELALDSGGIASGTILGGVETVAAGGADFGATVSGGFQDIHGTVSGALLLAGGTQTIESGGIANATVLDDNDTQIVFGVASGTVVSATDTQLVEAGGVAVATVVSSGGFETVLSGGTAIGTTVLTGGTETVSAGGADLNATINGGFEDVFGSASGAVVVGGRQTVEAGGFASGTVLQSGASQSVFGSALATTISAGDSETVQSGGIAVSPVIAGGTLELTPAGQAGGTIAFTASGGLLRLDGSSLTTAPIAGFGSGDSIDLASISANGTSYSNGVLSLLNGTATVGQLNLSTPFVTPAFSLAPDGSGGTLVTVGPRTVPTGPSSLFDFVYTYNDQRDYYYGMVADNGTFGYQVGQVLGTANGAYTIYGRESGTSSAAPGTVFVDYFSHGGVGQASTTPVKFAAGQPDGLGGLGTESDFIIGTDGQNHAFSSTLEPQLSASSLFGFVFTYADGTAYYTGSVADDGSYGYGAVADGNGIKTVFDSAGQLQGYYFIYREGNTALPAGTVQINGFFSAQTGQAYAVDPNASGGFNGLTSETGIITVNGTRLAFGDPPEPAVPVDPAAMAGDIAVTDMRTHQQLAWTAAPYSGPVPGLEHQFVFTGLDPVNVAVADGNWFLHGGPGDDALAAHGGYNVLDGGTGSNFLTGGGGTNTFFVDDRAPPADIWSTANGFGAGDDVTVFGIVPTTDFSNIQWVDGQGAAGFTGLTLHVTTPNQPTASLTLPGYGTADLSNGRLSVDFGVEPDHTPFMHIKANG